MNGYNFVPAKGAGGAIASAAMLFCFSSGLSQKAVATDWSREPFVLEVGGRPLDTADESLGGHFAAAPGEALDRNGHAAPFLVDLNGDDRRDLVLGTYAGQFRYYVNTGSDEAPVFPQVFSWLMAGDETARVAIGCCVASGPQLADIDGDGILDLTAGSYYPGTVHWFKGLKGGAYTTRQMLTDMFGWPVVSRINVLNRLNKSLIDPNGALGSNIAWVDWDNDGHLDMLLGSGEGELFVKLSYKHHTKNIVPIASQPTFWDGRSGESEIRIGGQKASPDMHAAPVVADWDADGLWDIMLGSITGAVYWLRNTGIAGKPKFESRQMILEPGIAFQWEGHDTSLRRGVRSQIHAVDFNRDGKMDLLVGDWLVSVTPRAALSNNEKRKLRALREQLDTLDRKAGYDYSHIREKTKAYSENEVLLTQATALEKAMAEFLKQYRRMPSGEPTTYKEHGRVWIYLRR